MKWAQRSDKIYITIELPDAENVKLKLDPDGKFFFSATSGADRIPYEIEFNLFDQVDVNESKVHVGSRNILYLVKKAESKWWSRLLKQEGKSPIFLKVDWDKWVDEDEEEDKSDAGFDDFDFSKMNMGGGGADFDTDAADEIGEDDEGSDTSDDEENAGATEASAVGGHEKNVGAEESSADGKHETEAKA